MVANRLTNDIHLMLNLGLNLCRFESNRGDLPGEHGCETQVQFRRRVAAMFKLWVCEPKCAKAM